MSNRYASRMELAKPSVIREMLKLAADPSIISFGGGNPDSAFFPWEAIGNSFDRVINEDWQTALQYSITEGFPPLRQALLEKMKGFGIDGNLDNLVITSGSQQGLDLTGKLFVDEDDEIIVESPSYMGAINAFKYYGPRFIEAEMDEEGMIMDSLEDQLRKHPKTKFIYTIPDFQNPTGITMSAQRRQKMVALAEEYDTIIVEDSPYIDLRFEGETIPPIKYFDKNGRVIYLGSISKILCPALRIGWVMAEPEIANKYVVLKQACDLHSNELGQRGIADFLRNNNLEQHISKICDSYKAKKEQMVRIIEEEFPKEIKYTNPQGGLFLWLTLPKGNNSNELCSLALKEEKVSFVPGSTFFPYGGHEETIRLSYATMPLEKIEEGMKRLAVVLNKYMKSV